MLISQTLYRILKQQNPEQWLTVVAPKSTAALARRMPEIDEVIEFDLTHGQLNLKYRWQLAKRLRTMHFKRAFILPNSLKAALIPWFARIPKRIGWLGEQRRILLNDVRKLEKNKYPTLAARYAALAFPKASVLPNLPTPQITIDQENQHHYLATANLSVNTSILALCPGAEYGSAKRWPIEYFAAIAQHYYQQGWQIWLFGGPKESSLGEQLQALSQNVCINLINKTGLLDAVDLLALASIVVSNDSGLMHIACAVAKPVVAIYGSSSPQYTPPLGTQVKILNVELSCSPCFQRECPLQGTANLRCLLDIKPAQVIAAIDELTT
jgi:heptosyltransferase-2